MNLQENIQRIKEVMRLEESTIPNELKRRIDLTRIEKLINKYKLSGFFPDKIINSSVAYVCRMVAGELLSFIKDEEEFERQHNILKNFIYNSYRQELTEYFEKRKEEYENLSLIHI